MKDLSGHAVTYDVMRSAQRVATYDRWLAAEIRASLDDPLPNQAHDEVMAAMDAEIDAVELVLADRGARP